MLTYQTRLDELKSTGRLPSPTGTALKVLELSQNNDSTSADIAALLKSDPSLAGKVLRVANSPKSGLSQPTANLPYAVNYLGMKTVRQLVLGFSVLANCPRGLCQGFAYDDFWRNSLATALVGQTSSSLTTAISSEEAYCCGLLGQIGRLALATVHPQRYSTLLQATSDSLDVADAEKEEFGINHNELTAAMLSDWGLPECFAEATLFQESANHDLADGSDEWQLRNLLQFSSQLAAAWLADSENRERSLPDLFEAASVFDLSDQDVAKIAEDAMSEWSDWCSILDLDGLDIESLAKTIEDAACVGDDASLSGRTLKNDTLRILIADSDSISMRYMQRHLVNAGHEVATAESGSEALRLTLEFNPHVILADSEISEMDGLALCRTIRESTIGRQVYLILLTSHDDQKLLTDAFAAGCDDYLTKPVYHQELCARTRAVSRLICLQSELNREKYDVQQYAAELSIGNRELQRKAWTDALTGLPNRRFARERLEQLWASSSQLSCMMIDVDNFKSVNDTFGHPAGDVVLRDTAAALSASIRKSDFLCRYGGEEFLVIYDGNNVEETRSAAERLCQNIANNAIDSDLFTGNVTVSIGVCVRDRSFSDIDSLLKSADDALYMAKQEGKNCVRVANHQHVQPTAAARVDQISVDQ